MASCHSHVDILGVMAVPSRRLGVGVLSWGRLVLIWGTWLSLKDCTISAKPGSHVDFFSTSLSGGVDTHMKIVGLPEVVGMEVVAAVVVKEMARGLEHQRKWVAKKEPLG